MGPTNSLILAVTVPLMSTPTWAAELWEEREAWSIMLSEDGACFASRSMEDGTEVQIGTDPARGGGFFAIYNAEWTDIEDGKLGTVEFNFGTSRFGGESEGRVVDGLPGGYVFFNNPAFVEAFASGQTVQISGKTGAVFDLDLEGTRNAVNGVFACQEAHPVDASASE